MLEMHHGRPPLIVQTSLPKLYVVVSKVVRLDIHGYMNDPIVPRYKYYITSENVQIINVK